MVAKWCSIFHLATLGCWTLHSWICQWLWKCYFEHKPVACCTKYFLENPLIVLKLLSRSTMWFLLLKMKLITPKKPSSCFCTSALWNKQKCWKNDIRNGRFDDTILSMKCFHSIHHSFWLFPKWGVIVFSLPFLND